MQNKYLYFLRLALVLSDFLVLNVAFGIAINFTRFDLDNHNLIDWKLMCYIVNLIWIVCTYIFKLYQFDPLNNYKRVFKSTIQSAILQLLIFMFYFNYISNIKHPWHFFTVFIVLMPFMLLVSRLLFIKVEPLVKKKFGPKKPTSLFAMDNMSSRLLQPYLNNNAMHHRFEVFDVDGEEDGDVLVSQPPTLKVSYHHIFKNAVDKGLDEVYISLSANDMEALPSFQKEADRHGIRVKLIYNFNKDVQSLVTPNYIGNLPVISLRQDPLEDINNIILKRAFDIVFSLLVIVFVLSWLYPIMALLITCESKGPVLFKQFRTGRSKQQFVCYKFRSMRVNALGDVKQASKQDERKTKIGHFIRRTSIDELPQFFNVLLGDMSVVGPRPHMLKHTEEYRDLIDNYMVRHYLKPGITGWAQVNGFRGETRTLDLMEKRIEHDIWSIENWSIILDIKIVIKTLMQVFNKHENAY